MVITRRENALKFIKFAEKWRNNVAAEYWKVTLWLKKICVEVHLHLQRNRVAVHHLGNSTDDVWSVGMQGVFPLLAPCWFEWSKMLLGLWMKNGTNEQLSFRPSLPREKKTGTIICYSEGKKLSWTVRTKHLFLEISAFLLIFHCASTFPVAPEILGDCYTCLIISHFHHYPDGIIASKQPAFAAQTLPVAHSFSSLWYRALPEISRAPFLSFSANWWRNLPHVQSLRFCSAEWRRMRVSEEQSSSR